MQRKMKKRRKNFSNKVKLKALLCCDRHCCLCGKQCSTNIEIHHIIPVEKDGDNSFENAIPLCFDCHAKVEMYNEQHPKGIKYKKEELVPRRNQIYDKYTSPYLPNLHFHIISTDKSDPKKSKFEIYNEHQYLSCYVRTVASVYHKKRLIHKFDSGVYGGKRLWHMNPESGASVPSHFISLPKNKKLPQKIESLQVQFEVTVIDKYGWEHKLLPVSWIYTPQSGWYYEPFSVK